MEITTLVEYAFSKITDAKELQAVAQDVVRQIHTAYTARLAEIKPGKGAAKAAAVNAPVASAKGSKTVTVEPAKVDASPEKKAPRNVKGKMFRGVEQVKIASLTRAQVKAMNIKFVQYSDKCMFVTGDTMPLHDEIMALGGTHWNTPKKGWFMMNDSAAAFAKALKIKM